jgi:hypothetical protein
VEVSFGIVRAPHCLGDHTGFEKLRIISIANSAMTPNAFHLAISAAALSLNSAFPLSPAEAVLEGCIVQARSVMRNFPCDCVVLDDIAMTSRRYTLGKGSISTLRRAEICAIDTLEITSPYFGDCLASDVMPLHKIQTYLGRV